VLVATSLYQTVGCFSIVNSYFLLPAMLINFDQSLPATGPQLLLPTKWSSETHLIGSPQVERP